MAKKAVASLQTGAKKMVKAIKMLKSEKTGSYTFKHKILNVEEVKDFFDNTSSSK
ncbi:DUF4295 domain-containing protein [Ichthyobacterium seriolicida]|uniref:DUF4295 domain-containing protein n=1 Tax=Ichthyobacterium seriolicida TaxID=242600 RepID=A0A1J1DY25_9FLAO|nr:DUF4295 domain-containing protein [Ichthyobacterium seriolicida]BAV94783.1 hypothetical protein JBKA6_0770 [Ichthyobacterium seriolicida]